MSSRINGRRRGLGIVTQELASPRMDLDLSLSKSLSNQKSDSDSVEVIMKDESSEEGRKGRESPLALSKKRPRDSSSDLDDSSSSDSGTARASKRARLEAVSSSLSSLNVLDQTQPLDDEILLCSSAVAWDIVSGLRYLETSTVSNDLRPFRPLLEAMPLEVRMYLLSLSRTTTLFNSLPFDIHLLIFAPLVDELVLTLLQVCRHWQSILAEIVVKVPRVCQGSQTLSFTSYFPRIKLLSPASLMPSASPFAHLAPQNHLHVLDLMKTNQSYLRSVYRLSNSDALALASCTSMRSLRVSLDVGCADGFATALDAMRHLVYLNINIQPLSSGEIGAWIPSLATLPELSKLTIKEGTFIAEHLSHLSTLTKLESICIRESPLTDSNAATLFPKLQSLRDLDLRDCPLLKLTAQWIRKCTQITSLALSNVTDKKLLASVVFLRDLRTLSVEGGRGLTGPGLAETVKYLPKLSRLNLSGCSSLQTLEWASNATQLTRLDLAQTSLVPHQIQRLSEVLPKLLHITLPSPSLRNRLRAYFPEHVVVQ